MMPPAAKSFLLRFVWGQFTSRLLTEAECDLIRDRCKYDIQFFYDPSVLPVEVGRAASGTFQ
jgi:hypothetical protein